MSKSRASFVILEDKAEDFRRIAHKLGFKYIERAVPDQRGAIRFTVQLTEEETLGLFNAVPRDFHARVAYLR